MVIKTLYKKTATGAIQIWYQELDGDRYRTVSGQKDGKLVTSAWTVCQPKNIGRINETTGSEQAEKEVEANYTKKLAQGGYSERIDDLEHKFFHPMLAKNYNDYVPSDRFALKQGVYCQPKLDGVRCIIDKNGMWTRTGKPIVSCPHIFEELQRLFKKWDTYGMGNTILDGELYNHDLKEDFNTIVSLVRKSKPTTQDLLNSKKLIQYHLYDSCYLGDGYRDLDFIHRHRNTDFVPRETWQNRGIYIVQTDYVYDQKSLDDRYQEYLELGYEGQMIRIPGKPYENKRSKFLLKRKEFDDTEFPIIDICEGIGNRSGITGYMVLGLPDGRTFRANVKGDRESLKRILDDRSKIIGSQATVEHFKLTPDGIPRFPRVSKIHEGEKI